MLAARNKAQLYQASGNWPRKLRPGLQSSWVFSVFTTMASFCSTAGGGGGGGSHCRCHYGSAVQYPGMADKIHKLLGFKFCEFSPERQLLAWGTDGERRREGVNVPEKWNVASLARRHNRLNLCKDEREDFAESPQSIGGQFNELCLELSRARVSD